MFERYRIVIADDNAFLRKELRSILGRMGEFLVVGEAGDGMELLDLLNDGVVPDALILDLSMPKMSGLEALAKIRQMHFAFKTLVLTMHKETDILCRAFSVGADGYMLKDDLAIELPTALRILLENKIYLSPLIEKELPETCRVKSCAGQVRSSSPVMHCGKNFSGPILQVI